MLNDLLHYKGYHARIEYDRSADAFHGRVLGTRDVIDFYGRTPDELRAEFGNSIDEYLAWCAEEGEKPEKSWAGKLTIRPDETLRRRLVAAAATTNQSINKFVIGVLDRETRKTLAEDG